MKTYLSWIISHRKLVVALTALATLGLVSRIGNLSVAFDFDTILPQTHPYIAGNNRIDDLFGLKHSVVIGVTANHGDVFQPNILAKVQRITERLASAKGVVRTSIVSVASSKVKDIVGTEDGFDARAMMPTVPQTSEAMARLKVALHRNELYRNILISNDDKTLGVIAAFEKEPSGFKIIDDRVRGIIDPERDDSVEIVCSGFPVFLAATERFAERMFVLFPIAILLIGLIHFEAFRTLQGLVLPLVTALLAVVWGLGIMGTAHVVIDPINSTTPILILAVTAGHAVQMLKRYYEEYHRLRADPRLDPKEANRRAVLDSVCLTGPIMIAACVIASISFLSLMVFGIQVIRTFGIFTAVGILSALVLEMTFIPALRAGLPPPSLHEVRREQQKTAWDRVVLWLAQLTIQRRRVIYAGTLIILGLFGAGMHRLVVDYSFRGMISSWMPIRIEDAKLNDRMGGTTLLYLLVDGKGPDSIKDPALLRAMDETEVFLRAQPHVGKTLSLVDFLKTMNKAMNSGKAEFEKVPETPELVAQYLLLYSISGDPTDFDSYVDYGYRSALLTAFLKTDSTVAIEALVDRLREFISAHYPNNVDVTIGGSAMIPSAFNEVMVKNKLLNIAQVALAVLFVSSLFFASVIAGLLILVPLAFTIIANFGIMGMTGIRLDAATALTSAMAVGIGADYAIYFACRLREELTKTSTEEEAIVNTFRSAGKAILFVSSAVAGGYAVLMLSVGFLGHIRLGFLIAFAMIVSCISALTVFPALLVSARPQFVFAAKGRPSSGGRRWAGWARQPHAARGDEAELRPTEIIERCLSLRACKGNVGSADG